MKPTSCEKPRKAASERRFGAFLEDVEAFERLPLACLIEGKILAVHGGIGNGKWTIDELAAAIGTCIDTYLVSICVYIYIIYIYVYMTDRLLISMISLDDAACAASLHRISVPRASKALSNWLR